MAVQIDGDFQLMLASAVWRVEKGEHYPVTKPSD